MKKILAWLLVLTLTAAVSIGATLAYLTDTDEDVNVMTLGNVDIQQIELQRAEGVKHTGLLKEGDLVSLRGFGRFRIKEIGGKTKKDRTALEIERYI